MKSAMHPEAREEFLAAIDYYNEAEPGIHYAHVRNFCHFRNDEGNISW